VAKQGSKSNIKNRAAELATLTYDEYPSEAGTLISYFGFMNTDLRFLQDAPAIKKKVEVQLGPFATLAERKVAIVVQKC
jgi:hypothetical protein